MAASAKPSAPHPTADAGTPSAFPLLENHDGFPWFEFDSFHDAVDSFVRS